jgi:hypothetical protein
MKNNDLQNIHIKLKDEVTLKTGGELRCSGRVASSYSTSGKTEAVNGKRIDRIIVNTGKH